jgi:hypothetical protein
MTIKGRNKLSYEPHTPNCGARIYPNYNNNEKTIPYTARTYYVIASYCTDKIGYAHRQRPYLQHVQQGYL